MKPNTIEVWLRAVVLAAVLYYVCLFYVKPLRYFIVVPLLSCASSSIAPADCRHPQPHSTPKYLQK